MFHAELDYRDGENCVILYFGDAEVMVWEVPEEQLDEVSKVHHDWLNDGTGWGPAKYPGVEAFVAQQIRKPWDLFRYVNRL